MRVSRVTVRKVGEELVLLFPDDLAEEMGLREGGTLCVAATEGGLLLTRDSAPETEDP